MAIGGGRGRGSSGGSVGADRDKSGGVRGRDAGNASGGRGPTTNEMAKRLSPRMDVPVNRTVDMAPRGLPNRSNEVGERVPNYPFASPWRGVVNALESIGPMGPITAPLKEAFGMTLGDRLGLEKGPQVGTAPAQTRSNLPGGSGVGGSVNSGGAIQNPVMNAFPQGPSVPFGPQPTAPTIPQGPQNTMTPLPGYSLPQGYSSLFPDERSMQQAYARQLS